MPKIAYKRRQERGEKKPVRVKIKKDDLVRVIAGRDKGKTGKVLEVDRFDRKVTVDGVMIVKRHTRPESFEADQGRHSRNADADQRFERDDSDRGRNSDPRGLQNGQHGRKDPPNPGSAQRRRDAGEEIGRQQDC